MPFALVLLLLDITLVYHAARTGRLQPWAFIILMIPALGALAYIVVELIPEMAGSPDVQRARRRVASRTGRPPRRPSSRQCSPVNDLAKAERLSNCSADATRCTARRSEHPEEFADLILAMERAQRAAQ